MVRGPLWAPTLGQARHPGAPQSCRPPAGARCKRATERRNHPSLRSRWPGSPSKRPQLPKWRITRGVTPPQPSCGRGRDPKGTWRGCAGEAVSGARSGRGRRGSAYPARRCLSVLASLSVRLGWPLPKAARAPSLPDPSQTDSQVHMEPKIIKIHGPRRPPACIPGVALDQVRASSPRSPAYRDPDAKGRGVRQGPSGEAQSRLSSGFPGATFRAALTSAIPRFLPFCSRPSRPHFLRERLPVLSATGPVRSPLLRGSRVHRI